MTTAHDVDVSLEALSAVCLDGIAFIDSGGIVVSWNDAAAQITGIATAKAIGIPLASLLLHADEIRSVATGERKDVRFGIMAYGEERQLAARAVAVDRGWIVSFGQQRRYAKIEQLKNEIVAAVSHELKTPIATIKAFAMTLRRNGEAVSADREAYLETIEAECDRLTEAVDDLLDAARVDVEHLLTRRVDVTLAPLLDDVATRLRLRTLHPLLLDHLDVTISGDPELLRSIFSHLLENAAKFSPAGAPIEVRAEHRPDAVVVHVRDHGVGIGEDHLPYIFERFYRVEDNMTSTTPGSGLGLFIAKMLARAHGTDINVRSSRGEGSTFSIAFPVRA